MKLTEAQLGWLAGILDGEGTICIYKEKASHTHHRYARCVIVAVANTNPLLVIRAARLIGEAGLKYSIGTIIGTQKKEKGWSRAWNVRVNGMDNMKRFLRMIRPHLIGKAEQAELALQFLARRSSKKAAWGISEHDELLMARCKFLNTTGSSESVETLRAMSEAIAFGKDIVRPARRRAEADGNAQPPEILPA